MNFRKLITYLTMGTAAAMPLAVAQNPTILQGSYISNVFGNSNFVLNPNALTNVANVAVSNATVTRVASTTNSLVATTEFNVTVTSANGTIAWNTRAFDNGMKGQNCEARFTYRGFQSTSVAQVRQGATVAGANVVARLALTASTDPRIASINFPCGDLSQPTYFVITDTATLSGTHEIGGAYVGLATNMANVAQAEVVVQAGRNTTQSIGTAATTIIWNTKSLDTYGEFDTSTGLFTAKRAGRYEINASAMLDSISWATNFRVDFIIWKNSTAIDNQLEQQQVTSTRFWKLRASSIIDLAVGDTIKVTGAVSSGTPNLFGDTGGEYNRLSIKRFPSSSELVVTPERQNVFGGVKITSSGHDSNAVTSASYTLLQASGAASPVVTTRTIFGKAKSESTNDYILSIDNMPVGNFQVQVSGTMYVQSSGVAGNATQCRFAVADSSTGGAQIGGTSQEAAGDASLTTQFAIASSFHGVYQNTAVGNRTFYVQAARGGGNGSCKVYIDSNRPLTISVIPLDQPSNSALYVQGPVKAAETGAAIPSGYAGKSEFGGGTGSGSALTGSGSGTTINTYSNVTPGVYAVRYYAGVQKTGAGTATYYFWTCNLTTNSAATVNWYDVVNSPHDNIGGGGYTAVSDIVNFASGLKLINVTANTTYYVRCGHNTNNSGFDIRGGAEFIRLN